MFFLEYTGTGMPLHLALPSPSVKGTKMTYDYDLWVFLPTDRSRNILQQSFLCFGNQIEIHASGIPGGAKGKINLRSKHVKSLLASLGQEPFLTQINIRSQELLLRPNWSGSNDVPKRSFSVLGVLLTYLDLTMALLYPFTLWITINFTGPTFLRDPKRCL